MTTTAKKLTQKKTAPRRAGKPKNTKASAAAKDRAERKKIGKTRDVAAFMADFKRDATSAAYWEKAE